MQTMPENIQQAIPLILLALGLVVAFWVIARASRKTTITDKQEGDVLDEGAAPAARNQALIDAEPSAVQDTGTPLESAAPEEEPTPAPDPSPAPAPAPSSAPAPTPVATPIGSDDLKRIKGLGPKLVTILAEQGITSFEQIAAWTEADIERIDATLGRFSGRITRDQWVEQAKLLSAGDEGEFSKTFGNNG
jgi:predicted flap endonuclease-1-like 5' DNA nuclease